MNEISLHILDIVQNSIAAGAKNISVLVTENVCHDLLQVAVADDGCGMSEDAAEQAKSPFTTSRKTRKVGLGIPLFQAGCLGCGGDFEIRSKPCEGTVVSGSYRLSHIDRPPLGNLADTMYLLVAANPALDFSFRHDREGRTAEFNTAQIRQALGGVPLDDPEVRQWIRQFLNEAELNLYGGAAAHEDDTGT